MKIIAAAILIVFAGTARSEEAVGPTVRPILKSATNSFGQPISFPQGPGQVAVSMYEIPVGAKLPVHEHPNPRIGYVLSGIIEVINIDTGEKRSFRQGDTILESVGKWHMGSNAGSVAVKLLVIDLQPLGASDATVLKR